MKVDLMNPVDRKLITQELPMHPEDLKEIVDKNGTTIACVDACELNNHLRYRESDGISRRDRFDKARQTMYDTITESLDDECVVLSIKETYIDYLFIVLAERHMKHSDGSMLIDYVTWLYNKDFGLCNGHYFGKDREKAEKDFTERT